MKKVAKKMIAPKKGAKKAVKMSVLKKKKK